MAKNVKADDGAPPVGGNIDGAKAAKFVGEAEKINEQIASEQGAYMSRVRVLREKRDNVYERAKNYSGVEPKAVKTAVKVRALERKVSAEKRKLEEPVEQIHFAKIREALGDYQDLPLGQAAVKAEETGADTTTH